MIDKDRCEKLDEELQYSPVWSGELILVKRILTKSGLRLDTFM